MKSILKANWCSYLWLLAATLCAIFSNGRWLIPLASWITPVLFLRFLHGQSLVRGLILGGVFLCSATLISWLGMTPYNDIPWLYIIVFFWIGVIFWIPYCIERILAPRLKSFLSTLIFPLAYVSMELTYTLTNPFLSCGSIAYTQHDVLPLLQILSVTGIWGITFLITWTASVLNWMRGRGFRWNEIRKGVGIFAGVLTTVLLFGEVRLNFTQSKGETVRVGTVAATKSNLEKIKLVEANPVVAHGPYQDVLEDYLYRTRRQADAGAKLVIWDELAVRVRFDSESAAVRKGQDLAREMQIYLLMALRVEDFPSGIQCRPRLNKAILIGPGGDILFSYLKSFPVPGVNEMKGDGRITVIPFSPKDGQRVSRLAVAICFDMDNPDFIRQAGSAEVGLMLNPAWNHPEDESLQSNMARFRAIENGFSLLRSTREGFSAAFDNRGRLLAVAGRTTADGLMLANVTIESTWTLYSRTGDLFGWLCVAGLAVMIVFAIRKSKRQDRFSS
jgi:apolipoprotein N-acyltransferase